MTWVWDHSSAKGTDRLVLLAIADNAADDGGNAYPSMRRLVAKTQLDERTVQRALKRLVLLGELSIRYGAGDHGQNIYRIRMAPRQDAAPGATPPPAERPPRQDATTPPGRESAPPRQSATQTILEPSVEPEPPCRTPAGVDLEARADLKDLCDHLADRIAANDPNGKRPTVGIRWLNDMRLLVDLDKREPIKVRAAIDWCQTDDFWKANIMSPGKLRKQYATLQLRAAEKQKAAAPSSPKRPQW